MRLMNMRLSLILYFVVTALCVQQTVSLPFDKRADADETFTLTFALEFEYLAVAFYTHGLALFKETDFIKAGFPALIFQRYQEMLIHEKTHAQLLANILGKKAPKLCKYSFSFSGVAAFVNASLLIEGVSASVYIGAMPFLTNETLQDVSAILSTEARHAAYVATDVVKVDPWGGPFDTPITIDDAFTLASQFTTSCPPTNPQLGLSELSTFNITGLPTPGQNITLHLPPIAEQATHVAFFSGLSVSFVDITDGKVAIPGDIAGMVYAFATNASRSEPLIKTLAGPTVIFVETYSNHSLIN